MPAPMKVRAPRPATPAVDTRRPPTAMSPGPADVVRARSQVGNAAVTAAMGGLPRDAKPAPTGWAGQMLLAGQDLVGNQAVASRAAAETPAQEGQKTEAGGPRSPDMDPKFQALKKDVAAKKKTVGTSHPPATAEAGAAQDAAVPPADDQEARGKAAHAEDMDAAQPKEFDKAAFIEAVEKAIRDRAPKNLDEADKFGESGKAEEVKTEVQGKVGEGKQTSAREIADTTAQVPRPAQDAKAVVPLAPDKVPGKPGTPNPSQAAPDALPPSATDMSAGPAQVNQQMADAQVTEQQLSFKKSREPGFDKAVRDKKSMDAHSAAAPKKLRAGESRELKQVKNTAAARGSTAMAGMHGTRVSTGQRVSTGKTGAKGRDEDKRTQVTALLQKVFDRTKCDVEKILSDLDKKVDKQFTAGEKRARDGFTTEHTEGMRRYKDERYSGVIGKARWVHDLFADLPEEANRIYERAKRDYLTAMRQVITDIAGTVERELHRAKDRIAAGRTELKAAVDKLPADLKAIGREAATEFEGQFEELKDTVNDKGTALVDTLATKYTDAVKAVDAEIAAEKEKNKGLVSKAADAIGGAIRTIKELGSLLLGVLRKAATAIGAILRDPIGFLGNLVTGVGGGLKRFAKNAGRHLEQGVLAWLLGTGVGGGLRLPARFDLLGIVMVLATLLGLSWANIRARLVRKVPPKAVLAAETAIPLLAATKRRGVAGMWPDLKGRVGDPKKDLISNLVSYLLPTIILAGITFIVSLFNPASAFIRACKMIIDIVRFIVTQARQIIEFVNAVLDAVIAIARGSTGSAAALVERALAKSIPVLIGLLAAILGIGGIPGKVRQIFQKLTRPVQRAINWVIDKMIGLVRKLWAKLKPKPRKSRRPATRDRPRVPRLPARRTRPRRTRPAGRRRPDRREKSPTKRQQRKLMAALREAAKLSDRTGDEDAVRRGLPAIRARHRLTVLTVATRPGSGDKVLFVFDGTINPRATFEHLAVDRYLQDAKRAFKDKDRAFAITDMVGPMGRHVPGLAKVLRLSESQARRYAEEWVRQRKLTKKTTARNRAVYSFVTLTDANLEVPLEHPEYERWVKGAAKIRISATEAKELWFLVIEGLRKRRTANFETVADVLLVNLRVAPGKGALWSMGVDLVAYATSLGFTTLEAQEFYNVTEGLVFLDNWDDVRPLWKILSARYAGKLRKEINIFMRFWTPGSIMVDVELEAVKKTIRVSGQPIVLKFHGMEWGDDPQRELRLPVPGYWRELTRDGKPLGPGQQQVLDESGVKSATEKARNRFMAKQALKRHRRKKRRKRG